MIESFSKNIRTVKMVEITAILILRPINKNKFLTFRFSNFLSFSIQNTGMMKSIKTRSNSECRA